MGHAKSTPKALSARELSNFCGQLSMIIHAGIPVTEGLTLMLEDAQGEGERAILSAILETVELGGSLQEAMDAQGGLFPEYMRNMVGLGEETGTLDEVVASLKTHYEREEALRTSVRSAVAYPSAMLGMMIVVVTVLLTRVMPLFHRVFLQLGTQMTGFSQLLMNLGTAINRYGVVLLALLGVLIALLLWAALTKSGKDLLRRVGYAIPFTRDLFQKTALCRFAGAMALTLRSGLRTERGMELAAQVSDDPFFQRKLSACTQLMDEGETLSRALVASGLFTGMHARLLNVGDRSGNSDAALEQIATLCQEDVDTRLSNLISIVEPTLVILLSVIVGVILLSVMLPLMGIMAGI